MEGEQSAYASLRVGERGEEDPIKGLQGGIIPRSEFLLRALKAWRTTATTERRTPTEYEEGQTAKNNDK